MDYSCVMEGAIVMTGNTHDERSVHLIYVYTGKGYLLCVIGDL